MTTPDLQLFYLRDGLAACACPHCDCPEQALWWSPSQYSLLWSLYECGACGAVTSVIELHHLAMCSCWH